MKNLLLVVLFYILQSSSVTAQDKSPVTSQSKNANDTIYTNTEPAQGFNKFVADLEAALSKGETAGKKYRVRIDNIGFFASKTGAIDSAWIIFRPRPIHEEIMKILKTTPWTPAEQDGQPVASHQEILDLDIYLTKATLKRYGHWRSLPLRIISPYGN